jgi:hypothetical protein
VRGLLNTRRQIDPVSNEIVALDGDIREMDAETHSQRLFLGLFSTRKRCADLHGATQRVYGAWKLGQSGVAGPIEDPAIEHGVLV